MGVIFALTIISALIIGKLYSKNSPGFFRYQQVYVPIGIAFYCLLMHVLKNYGFFGFLSGPINFILGKLSIAADWKVAIFDYLISIFVLILFVKIKDFLISLYNDQYPSMSDLGWSKRFYKVYHKQVFLRGEYYYLAQFARVLSYVFAVLVFASFFIIFYESYFPSYSIFLLAIFLEVQWFLNGTVRNLVQVEEKKKEKISSDLILLWNRYQEIWHSNIGVATNRTYSDSSVQNDFVLVNDILIENFKSNDIFSIFQEKVTDVIQRRKNVIIFIPNLDYIVSTSDEANKASKDLVLSFRDAILPDPIFRPLISIFRLPTDEKIQVYFTQIDSFLNLSFTLEFEEWLSNIRLSIFLEYDQTLLHSPESTVAASKILKHYIGEKFHEYTSVVLAEERHNQQEAWISNLNITPSRKKQTNLSDNLPHRVYFLGWKRECAYEDGILDNNREEVLPLYALSFLPLSMRFNEHYIVPKGLPYKEVKENLLNERSSWTEQYQQLKLESPEVLKNHLIEVEKMLDLPLSEQLIISIFDYKYNAPLLYKYYASHAIEETLVNIVSPPHIGREYFWEFLDYFVNDPIEPLSYKLITNDPLNILIALTEKLTKCKLTLEEIGDELKKFDNKNNTENILERLKTLYQTIDFDVLESSYFKASFVSKDKLLFSLDPAFKQDLEIYKDVIFEDDNSPVFSLNKNLYAAKYAIGQLVIFLGRLYEINSIQELQSGQLKVSLTNKENSLAPSYKFIKNINVLTLQHCYFHKEVKNNYSKKLLALEVNVINKEYCEYLHIPDFAKHIDYKYILIDVEYNPNSSRYYKQSRAVLLEFLDTRDKDSLAFPALATLIIFIEEYLKILFPESHDLLIVRPVIADDVHPGATFNVNDDVLKFYQLSDTISLEGVKYGILILEDTIYDLGHTQTLYENIDYVFEGIQDLLIYYTDFPNHSNYLKFGFNTYSDVGYDIDAALKLTEKIFQLKSNKYRNKTKRTIKTEITQEVSNINETCDFCRTIVLKSNEGVVLDDGLFICKDCKSISIDDGIFSDLIDEAKQFYFEEWGIDNWPVDLKFRLAGAKEIMSYYPDIGFKPTEKYDFRWAGLAIQDAGNYMVLVESHRNEEDTMLILIHELCHIYQYVNLDHSAMRNDFDRHYIEGHARWAELSFVRSHRCEQRFPHLTPEIFEESILRVNPDYPEYAEGYALIIADAMKNGFTNLHKYLLSKYRRTELSSGYAIIVG